MGNDLGPLWPFNQSNKKNKKIWGSIFPHYVILARPIKFLKIPSIRILESKLEC